MCVRGRRLLCSEFCYQFMQSCSYSTYAAKYVSIAPAVYISCTLRNLAAHAVGDSTVGYMVTCNDCTFNSTRIPGHSVDC
jgi:hypothetical protein